MELIPIQKVTFGLISERVKSALEPRFAPDVIADFVACVDWSGELNNPAIERLLGTLSHWDTEFAERDITEAEYTERLRSVLVSKVPA